MDNDLRKKLDELKKIGDELGIICEKERKDRAAFEERIAIERKEFEKKIFNDKMEFERSMLSLSDRKQQLSNDFSSLANDSVSVRLGNLIEELASLTDIDVSNIDINFNIESNIDINVKLNNKDIIKVESEKNSSVLIGTINCDADIDWKMLMTGMCSPRGTILFNYSIHLNSKLNEVQADGKTFLEHCTAMAIYDDKSKKYRVCLYIDKNVADLILNISLIDLIGKAFTASWYPADLMVQAVINCTEKSQEKEVSKKRSRKLSDETNKVGVND